MITAEVEPFSQFFADAVELPLFQGGTMLTVLVFVFVQDPIMGPHDRVLDEDKY